MTLVDFLVVGAMKSGTTTLNTYLSSHPEVQMPIEEVHFFDRNYDRGPAWYRSQLGQGPPGVLYGEGSPQYLYWQESLERIRADAPEVRLIAILRDPVDRAYSHYWHNRTRGHEPLDFRSALAAEPERMANPDQRFQERFAYRDLSRYDHQLTRLFEMFPGEQIHVLRMESLTKAPDAELARVWSFLGLSPMPVDSSATVAKNRFVEFRSQRLRAPIRRLPSPIRRVAARLNIRYRPYPPMDDDLRRELTEEFAPARQAVDQLLGDDPERWTSDSSLRK